MQTVLVLSPYLTSAPEVVENVPPVTDGAFLSSFEPEPSDAAPEATPVMLAVSVAQMLPLPVDAIDDGVTPTGKSVADTVEGTAAPLEGAAVGAETRNDGTSRPPSDSVAQVARAVEMTPDSGMTAPRGMAADLDAAPDAKELSVAMRSGLDATATPPVAEESAAGSSFRSTNADAALTAARTGGKGSEGSPSIPADRAPRVEGATSEGHPKQTRAAGHPVPVQDLLQSAALPVVAVDRPERAPARADSTGKATPIQVPVETPATIRDSIATTVNAARDSTDSPGTDTATEAQPSTAAAPDKPESADQVRTLPLQAGFWERIFTSLPLPLSANHALTRAVAPELPTSATAPTAVATSIGGAGVIPPQENGKAAEGRRLETAVADGPTAPIRRADATGFPTAAPLAAPSVVLWADASPLVAAGRDHDAARAEEALQSLFAPGATAATGLSAQAPPHAVHASPALPVAAQIVAALSRSGDGATELALSPDELGTVRLRLEPDAANPDRMVVMITFERPETLDLFRRHEGELADALRDAGYSGADIGFGQDQSGSGGSEGAADHSAGRATGQNKLEPDHPHSSAPRLAAGASLDLRL